jgi:NTP pyrophosphatase (non-canonical NTP hydrolase)
MITRDQWQEYCDDVLRHCPTDHPNRTDRDYALLGLAGETGEFLDALKKRHWHVADVPSDKLIEEAGDVMWYVALIASQGHAVGSPDAVYAYRRGAEPLQTWLGDMARKIVHELGRASSHVAAGGQWYAGRLVEMVSSILDEHGLSMADALTANRAKLAWRHGEGYRADHYQTPNPWVQDEFGTWRTAPPSGRMFALRHFSGGRWGADEEHPCGTEAAWSSAQPSARAAVLDLALEITEHMDPPEADELLAWAMDVPLPPGCGEEVGE